VVGFPGGPVFALELELLGLRLVLHAACEPNASSTLADAHPDAAAHPASGADASSASAPAG